MRNSRIFLAAVLLAFAGSAEAVEYQAGWEYRAFFDEVATCKAAVVIPGAAKYQASALKAGVTQDALRSQTIAMLPAFEIYSAALCYCSVGEVAKNLPLEEYRGKNNDLAARLRLIKEQGDTPKCKAEADAVGKSLDAGGGANALMLR